MIVNCAAKYKRNACALKHAAPRGGRVDLRAARLLPLVRHTAILRAMQILKGKSAIVTGAASGIGRASAMLFAAEGAAVVALDRAGEVESTAAAIRSTGGRAVALVG